MIQLYKTTGSERFFVKKVVVLLLLFIGFVHGDCLASFYNYEQMSRNGLLYKREIASYLCNKALDQNKQEIAERIGAYALGANWETNYIQSIRYKKIYYSFEYIKTTNHPQYLILLAVGQEYSKQFPDLIDWMSKQY